MLKKGLIAGFAVLLLGLVFTFGLQAIIPGLAKQYQTQLFRPWNDPLMMAYFLYPFILGIVAAYLWDLIKDKLKGESTKKAYEFAKLYFIIATIPGMFITYTSFNVSLLMILSWTVVGFLEAFLAGFIFTKIK